MCTRARPTVRVRRGRMAAATSASASTPPGGSTPAPTSEYVVCRLSRDFYVTASEIGSGGVRRADNKGPRLSSQSSESVLSGEGFSCVWLELFLLTSQVSSLLLPAPQLLLQGQPLQSLLQICVL